MSWANEQPISYYKPVAPEVPVADTTAAKIIASGRGVEMFTQRAIAAEKAQIDHEQMLQQADLQANQLQFQREQLAQQHELGIRGQDIQNKNVLLDYDVQNRRIEVDSKIQQHQIDHLDALTDLAHSQADGYGSALSRQIEMAKYRADLIDKAQKDADGLGLWNEQQWTEHPMIAAKNALGFEKMYGATTDPELKKVIKQFVDKANESKVKLDGPEGNVTYPWAQVVQDLERNGPNSPFVQALTRAGMLSSKATTTNIQGKDVPTTDREPKPFLKNILQDAKAANFSELDKIKSQVQPFEPKTFADAVVRGKIGGGGVYDERTTKAGRLNPGAPLPPPDVSEFDKDLDDAKRAMAAHPEKADGIRAEFARLYPGKDPALLGP